jgi:hypothetical protein
MVMAEERSAIDSLRSRSTAHSRGEHTPLPASAAASTPQSQTPSDRLINWVTFDSMVSRAHPAAQARRPTRRRTALGIGLISTLTPATLTSVLRESAAQALEFTSERAVTAGGWIRIRP